MCLSAEKLMQVPVIRINADSRIQLGSSSKGDQVKWLWKNQYIKADCLGYESIAEVAASLVLECSNVTDFVSYRPCIIEEVSNENSDIVCYNGCYSHSFLQDNQETISVYRLLQLMYPDADKLLDRLHGGELAELVVKSMIDMTGIDLTAHFALLTKLDCLLLNEDRHLNNICLILDAGNFCAAAPIFDNGLSLLSDTNDYPLSDTLQILMRKVKAKPFSASFKKQITYFAGDLIQIDYDKLQRKLSFFKLPNRSEELARALSVLEQRLNLLEGIVWKRM